VDGVKAVLKNFWKEKKKGRDQNGREEYYVLPSLTICRYGKKDGYMLRTG
jgi:hypothetical protein